MKKRSLLLPLVAAIACVSAHAAGAAEFPDPGRAWLPEGTLPNLDNLRQVTPGLTKNEVYALIAEPHFSEWFGADEWNYIFRLRSGDGNGLRACQYQIRWDHGQVAQTAWRDPACAALAAGRPAAVPVAAPAAVPAQAITLGADALFAFNSAVLTADGQRAVTDLAQRLKPFALRKLTVTGYTDRLGSASYNLALSQRRAQAVAQALAAAGVNAAAIQARGAGASNPVVDCPGPSSEAVIACLAPNRRVTVKADAAGQPSGTQAGAR